MSLPLELLLHGHGHGHGHGQLSINIKLQPTIRCSAHPIPNLRRLVKTTVEDKNDELGGFRRPNLQLLLPPSPRRRRRRQEQGSSSSSSLAAVSIQGRRRRGVISAALRTLDLTEDNVKQVLADARDEFGHLFDDSVGMTGKVELAEVDGPFVKISLRGRFWHKRSTVLDRFANYLKQRIPEILEVDIEDEKQLDDSPENFWWV